MEKNIKPKGNLLGIISSFLYLIFLFFMVMSEVPFTVSEKMSWDNYIKGSVIGTLYAIGLLLAILGFAAIITKFLSDVLEHLSEKYEEYKENNLWEYDLMDAIKSTIYWVNKTVDLIMSIFVPGAIALFYFGNKNTSTFVEGLTNLVILCLLPTMVFLKLGEYLKVMFVEIVEIIKLIFKLIKYFIESAISIFVAINKVLKCLIDKGK